MSPPCVAAIYEGDNGGATARGVTATEISVAVPIGTWCDVANCQAMIQAYFDFFNQRFELYGRRLRPVFPTGAYIDVLSARALGAQTASLQSFAALTGPVEWDGAAPALQQELGRQQVVTIMRGIHASDRTLFDELHPYLWAVQPSTEQWQRNAADFACASLIGRPARHAGTPSMQSQTRKFGIVVSGGYQSPAYNQIVSSLRECGAEPAVIEWKGAAEPTTVLRTGLESLRAAGVTTVICVCSGYWWQSILGQINSITGFLPEILRPLSSQPKQEEMPTGALRGSIFGISAEPKLLPIQTMSWYQAGLAVNPTLMAASQTNYLLAAAGRLVYDNLLVLAAGVQGAGPALTPDTFAAGLMATQFTNSGAGQAPYWQPSVGFGPGDHSFYNDFSISWWNNQEAPLEPETTARGTWCYVAQGSRYSVGRYPANADDLVFRTDLPCR